MVELAATIFADGPSSDPSRPMKPLIRDWGTWIEGVITAFTSNGGLIYVFKSTMDGDLAHPANVMAWVIGDPVVANNGIYKKLGASGAGSWSRMADLPYSFIIASDVGAGTPNAIQATSSIPVSASALVWMNIFEANTAAPVTVSFNGGSALTIKTNSGNDVAAGGLVAGMIVLGIVSGMTFRLVSDQASSAILAAAQAAQAAAEAAQASAEAASAAAQGVGYSVAVWPSGATKTMIERSKYLCHISDFDIDLTGANDDTSVVQTWLTQAQATGVAQAESGLVRVTQTLFIPGGVKMRGVGRHDIWKNGFTNNPTPSQATVFLTNGAGNPARWTDIDGSDAATFTPMFVAAGNQVYLEDLTLWSDNAQPWSAGFYVPGVRQCGMTRADAFGFNNGCLYLDATWSSRNTTLEALHPEVESSLGMNEFAANDCWFEAIGTNGFAIKVQGTARAHDAVPTADDWLWAPGGTSDLRFNQVRMGAAGSAGGCYSHDAQLFGATAGASLGRGIMFDASAFRASSGGRYAIKLDRSDGHTFVGCYAEGQGASVNEIAVTSRTQEGAQGNVIIADRFISGDVTVDGVVVSTTTIRQWEDTRCISYIKVDGDIRFPNFNAGKTVAFDDIPAITSFNDNEVLARFVLDVGGVQTEHYRIAEVFIRPQIDGVADLGEETHRFKRGYLKDGYQSGTISVADDAAASIPTPKKAGFCSIMACGTTEDSNTPQVLQSGIVCFDTGTSVAAQKVNSNANNFVVVATDVTGTTGTDGNVTVGVIAGNLRVENRSGGALIFRYAFFG